MVIFNFSSISEISLAHPHVARNIMLKFQEKLNFFRPSAAPRLKLWFRLKLQKKCDIRAESTHFRIGD